MKKTIFLVTSLMAILMMFSFASAETITLHEPTLFGSTGVIDSYTSYIGDASWANNASKFELYLTPEFLFGRNISINEIEEISYHTYKETEQGGVNFYLNIYTMPPGDASWYGHRLTLEPLYAYNFSDVVGVWNEWSTSEGMNQLTFIDSNHGPIGYYGAPTLTDIQSGNITWPDNSTFDHSNEMVKYIVVDTGNPWTTAFEGNVDALKIILTTGENVTVDLEGPLPPTKADILISNGVPGKGLEHAPGLNKPRPNENFAKGTMK